MGWVLRADCDACGHSQPDLRLGGTHAEIGQHDVCHRELYRAACCGAVQSVLVYMGAGAPEASCERCDRPLTIGPDTLYRITTLQGERLTDHPCPRCSDPARLRFTRTGSFV